MEENEAAWVRRAQGGDPEAFRELVEAYSRPLFRLAYRLTGTEEHADDVVQETFLKAYRNLHRFDGRAQWKTWLYRIAVNCAMDHLRQRQRNQRFSGTPADELPLPSPEPGPERRARSAEVAAALRVALPTLSPLERAAFTLRHHEGRSLTEINELLGLQGQAAKQAVFRAVQKLRAALEPLVGAVRRTDPAGVADASGLIGETIP